MILAVDCGNSRLKWGLHDGERWARTGTVPLAGVASLKKAWKGIPQADKIVVANVGGPLAQRRLETATPSPPSSGPTAGPRSSPPGRCSADPAWS